MPTQLNLQNYLRLFLGIIISIALIGASFFIGLMTIVLGAGVAASWFAVSWWQRRKEEDRIITGKFQRESDDL